MNTKTPSKTSSTTVSAKLPSRNLRVSAAVGVLAVGSLMAAGPVDAAQATGTPPGTVTVIAWNLDNPRGLAFGPDGGLFIAEAGHGGSLCVGAGPEGPSCVGLSSRMSQALR